MASKKPMLGFLQRSNYKMFNCGIVESTPKSQFWPKIRCTHTPKGPDFQPLPPSGLGQKVAKMLNPVFFGVASNCLTVTTQKGDGGWKEIGHRKFNLVRRSFGEGSN